LFAISLRAPAAQPDGAGETLHPDRTTMVKEALRTAERIARREKERSTSGSAGRTDPSQSMRRNLTAVRLRTMKASVLRSAVAVVQTVSAVRNSRFPLS